MNCACGRKVTAGKKICWRCFADDLVNLDYAEGMLEHFRVNERELNATR